jgi:hypothetical protein
MGGVCRLSAPANDTCATAQTIALAMTQQSIAATTVGANNNLTAPCGFGGADVWFRFTLAQREIVYADTVGATYDTILYFASSCSTPLSAPALPGAVFCNDDMASAGCSGGGLQSQVVAILEPGTYFLVLVGYGGATGPASIRFQHLPVGNGALAVVNPGSATYSGVTSGAGRVSGSCGGGGAPENTLWWKSCPDSVGGAFSATTCSRASWDTLLYVRNGDGVGDACIDDTCGLQTTVSSTLGRGAGLHVLYIDGFGSSAGSYSVVVSRP